MVQGWGMTETSPAVRAGHPAQGHSARGGDGLAGQDRRVVPGVEIRAVPRTAPCCPVTASRSGSSRCAGPWITASYYGDPAPERFHDGWLRTGDIGSLDGKGFMQISDRTKDVIKSGGEWISSVELENEVMAHPGVFEAAVIAVPDRTLE